MKNLFVIDSKVPEPTAEKTEVEVGYALPTGIDEIPPFIFWGGVGKSAGKKVVKEVAEEFSEKALKTKVAEELLKPGRSKELVERTLSDKSFSQVKVDKRFNSAFQVNAQTKELIINPELAAKMSDDAFEFGLRHERAELLKMDLRAVGKIMREEEIDKLIDTLALSSASKKELKEMIEHRLIADKIVLKEGGDAVRLWKAEAKILTENVEIAENIMKFDKTWILKKSVEDQQRYLSHWAYLKALEPSDSVLINKLNNIIELLPAGLREQFDNVYNVAKDVIKNA